MAEKFTTTDAGAPAPSVEHSLTVGPDGPILLQDHYLIEQMANFNRERIPERQPHAKGGGAFGKFVVTNEEGEDGIEYVAVFSDSLADVTDNVEPIRRQVAVKILKAGMDSARVIARFQAERQTLALMDHPCIAKVFDAGRRRHRT